MVLQRDFYDILESIKPFLVDDMVYFKGGYVNSSIADDDGAGFYTGLDIEGCYNVRQLLLLKDIIETIDFSKYPRPCPFTGNYIRGAIIGVKRDNVQV
jgi:hypothetical protein